MSIKQVSESNVLVRLKIWSVTAFWPTGYILHQIQRFTSSLAIVLQALC